MLVIKEEKYPIKVGVEVYNVEYPSFEETQQIAKEFNGLSGEDAIEKMKSWLMKLGLEDKFFGLKVIKTKHIMQIWQEINSVKK